MIDKYHPKNKEKIVLLSDEDRKNLLQKYEINNQKLFTEYISFLPTDYYQYKLPETSKLELVS